MTLMHFVWPQHVEERGGLRAAEFPELVRRLCRPRPRRPGRPCPLLDHDQRAERAPVWLPEAVLDGREYAWPPGLPGRHRTSREHAGHGRGDPQPVPGQPGRPAGAPAGPGGERRLVSANSYYLGLPNRLWRLPIPLMQWVDWRARSEKGWSEEDWVLREGRIVLRPAPHIQGAAGHRPRLVAALAAGARLSRLYANAKIFATLFSFIGANWWQLGMRGQLPGVSLPARVRWSARLRRVRLLFRNASAAQGWPACWTCSSAATTAPRSGRAACTTRCATSRGCSPGCRSS